MHGKPGPEWGIQGSRGGSAWVQNRVHELHGDGLAGVQGSLMGNHWGPGGLTARPRVGPWGPEADLRWGPVGTGIIQESRVGPMGPRGSGVGPKGFQGWNQDEVLWAQGGSRVRSRGLKGRTQQDHRVSRMAPGGLGASGLVPQNPKALPGWGFATNSGNSGCGPRVLLGGKYTPCNS